MRAAVFHGRGDIRIEDVPVPDPGPGEVLVRVDTVGVCGTDAHEYAHGPNMFPIDDPHPVTGHVGPMIPGHELAGTIEAMGPGVEGFDIGQLVVSGAGISCGACPWCRRGRTNLCERYATVGLQRNGGLAEFCAVPASTLAAADDLPPDTAALGQPMAIAVHAMRRGRLATADTAVVIGVGGIGAFLVFAASELGAMVVASDLDEDRLRIASALGAETTLDAGREPVTAGLAGRLPDVVYEVTGTAAGLRAAIDAARPGTRIVAVGLQGSRSRLDVRDMSLRELELIGTNAHVCDADLPEALRLLAARTDPWSDVAPVALSLERLVSDGLVPLSTGQSSRIKTLVDPRSDTPRPTDMRGG